MYQNIAILALFILVYSSVAGRVERSWLSGPILFTVFGLLIGPVGLELLSFKSDKETIRTLAELTLALVLFTDAAGADMGVLRKAKGTAHSSAVDRPAHDHTARFRGGYASRPNN